MVHALVIVLMMRKARSALVMRPMSHGEFGSHQYTRRGPAAYTSGARLFGTGCLPPVYSVHSAVAANVGITLPKCVMRVRGRLSSWK